MPGAFVLPDILPPGLDLAVCGAAAGRRSAEVGAYYAGSGNRFWRILHETGLTPRLLGPEEFRLLPEFGIGLTDLAK
ncbi:MAG: mismatch-specific DNA-glycosylase, partial [Alphaproteobacteria bacterium]|nr:mismatch-specific DNA-glycosylase [Alphaproteobacteria bacterium]